MVKISIETLAREQLEAAIQAPGGRAAHTVFGGHEKTLRQTIVGLRQGIRLGEHDNNDDATIYVLQGRIRLLAGQDSWESGPGEMLIVPLARHSIEALEDSALLMSVAKGPYVT